jgi:hypothetical protein
MAAITVLPYSGISHAAHDRTIRSGNPPIREAREAIAVSRHSSPIDQRPFQAKATLENQLSLVSQYGEVAIQEVAEALHHLKARTEAEERPADLASAA